VVRSRKPTPGEFAIIDVLTGDISMAEWHVLQPQCRKGGVTLESPKILPEVSTQLAFVGKLGLRGCFAELEARPSEDRQATPSLNFTAHGT
jgi:hypothetical protein